MSSESLSLSATVEEPSYRYETIKKVHKGGFNAQLTSALLIPFKTATQKRGGGTI